MPYLIGTDEAGYGPNLGPLVITSNVWHVDAADACDLYERLKGLIRGSLATDKPAVADKRSGARNGSPTKRRSATAPIDPPRQLAIADSKLLYKSGDDDGVLHLERGVLAMLNLLGSRPRSWGALFRKLLDGESLDDLCGLPWHREYELVLPLDADGGDIDGLAAQIRPGFAEAGVRLVDIRSAAVFPARFNRLTGQYGNKAEVLSRLTLELVAASLTVCQGAPVFVICDKHGGRNRYGPLLQRQFPDPLVEVHGESTAVSIYRWQHHGQRVEVRFQAGGESWLPAAFASMVSKYLRELAMRAFNEFWCGHIPDLRPTAGYPDDSHRFKQAIAEKQATLGIEDRILWRER
jgi:hypothetical protein